MSKTTWRSVPLGELLKPISREEGVASDRRYDILGAHWYAKGLYTKESKYGSEIAASKVYRVEKGDFVYNRLFAWKGSFALATEDNNGCYVSNEFPCFAVNRDRLELRFLLHYFSRETAWNEALGLSSGGTPTSRNRLKETMLLRMMIPLPPLPEQQRIVAKIEGLAGKIDEARSIRQRLIAETDSAMSSVTDSVFGSVQCTWRTIDELVGRDLLRNGKSVRPVDLPTGVQCIRLSALENGRINCRDAKPVAITQEEATPYLAKLGDVFVMRGNGSKHLVGRAGLVEKVVPGTIFPDLFIRIPLEGTGISSHFFVRFWNSGQMRAVIENTCKTTSGIWKINQGHIASFLVPVPSPPEQRRIVAYLEDMQAKVDSLRALQAQSATELDALVPSILDKAFKGEL